MLDGCGVSFWEGSNNTTIQTMATIIDITLLKVFPGSVLKNKCKLKCE